jgi:hypothetical protein
MFIPTKQIHKTTVTINSSRDKTPTHREKSKHIAIHRYRKWYFHKTTTTDITKTSTKNVVMEKVM